MSRSLGGTRSNIGTNSTVSSRLPLHRCCPPADPSTGSKFRFRSMKKPAFKIAPVVFDPRKSLNSS